MSVFDVGAIILLLATGVSIINERYFGLPRVIALLLGSLLLSLTVIAASHVYGGFLLEGLLQRRVHNAHLHNVLLGGILALLLFASSLQANLHDLRINALAVLCLATIGVFISTALFTFGIWGVFKRADWPRRSPGASRSVRYWLRPTRWQSKDC